MNKKNLFVMLSLVFSVMLVSCNSNNASNEDEEVKQALKDNLDESKLRIDKISKIYDNCRKLKKSEESCKAEAVEFHRKKLGLK